MFYLYKVHNGSIEGLWNIEFNPDVIVYEKIDDGYKEIALKDIPYNKLFTRNDLLEQSDLGIYKKNPNSSREYHIARIDYGDVAGYHGTDLIFAGDLILNAGETLVALLDKIKNMLGEFEYFYDVNGRFIF
jgi:hypothetical protein